MAGFHCTRPAMGANHNDPHAIEVWITPTVERDYKRRDAFPHLRIENARRIERRGTGVHSVSVEGAEAIFKDALKQYGECGRDALTAYAALRKRLWPAIKHAKGQRADPGPDVALALMRDSPAQFKVGDNVLDFSDDDEYGIEACIVAGYRLFGVREEFGAYIASDGVRIDYRFGYGIKHKETGELFFVPAHCLTRDDCKPTHLRLVNSPPARAGHMRQATR